MRTIAYQSIDDFLSENQIKKYHLKGCKAVYSLLSSDKDSPIEVVDEDGFRPGYLKKKGEKWIFKYYNY